MVGLGIHCITENHNWSSIWDLNPSIFPVTGGQPHLAVSYSLFGGESENRTRQAICLQSKSGCLAHPPLLVQLRGIAPRSSDFQPGTIT